MRSNIRGVEASGYQSHPSLNPLRCSRGQLPERRSGQPGATLAYCAISEGLVRLTPRAKRRKRTCKEVSYASCSEYAVHYSQCPRTRPDSISLDSSQSTYARSQVRSIPLTIMAITSFLISLNKPVRLPDTSAGSALQKSIFPFYVRFVVSIGENEDLSSWCCVFQYPGQRMKSFKWVSGGETVVTSQDI